MPSAIDPTKPADGVAAVKGDLRASLSAARVEVEHMGFYDRTTKGSDALETQVRRLDALDTRIEALTARVAVLDGGAGPAVPVNTAPIARNDTATVAQDSANNAIVVLANDEDPDDDALSVVISAPPNHGTATVDAQNRVLYTPAAGFSGADFFLYKLLDNRGGETTGRVDVTVDPGIVQPPAGPTDAPADWPDLVGDASRTLTLQAGVPFIGRAETASAGDSDYLYLFEMPAYGDFTASFTGGDATTNLYLYAADATSKARGADVADTEGLNPRRITVPLYPGWYYLGGFTSAGAATSYTPTLGFAAATPPVVVAPPPTTTPSGGWVYGVNTDRDVLVTSGRAAADALRDPMNGSKHIVFAKGRTYTDLYNTSLGPWFKVTQPGRVIRSEERRGAILGRNSRFVLGRGSDGTKLYGFEFQRGQTNDRNDGHAGGHGHGTHVLCIDTKNCLVGDIYAEDIAGIQTWMHGFSTHASNGSHTSCQNNTFRGLVLHRIIRGTAAGQSEAYPKGTVFEDCWFTDCGVNGNRESLVLQINQGGEVSNYPAKTDASWTPSRCVLRRCVLLRVAGFASQFKVGGGLYQDCIIVGRSANLQSNFQSQDFYNFRMGGGSIAERCISQNVYDGFLMQAQDSIMRDCIVIDPGYSGVRMWRGSVRNGNEYLPSLRQKVYNCTFDMGAMQNGGARGVVFDSDGPLWNDNDTRDNEFRNNIFLAATAGNALVSDPKRNNRWSNNIFWSKQGRPTSLGNIPTHENGLKIVDPLLTRVNRRITPPDGIAGHTLPIPVLRAGSPAIGTADARYASDTDNEGRARAASPWMGALERLA